MSLKAVTKAKRTLTYEEQKDILDSCFTCAESVDIQEDFCIRYQSGIYEYFTAANINTLPKLLVPYDSDMCNVTGNMNYTEHFKGLHGEFQ